MFLILTKCFGPLGNLTGPTNPAPPNVHSSPSCPHRSFLPQATVSQACATCTHAQQHERSAASLGVYRGGDLMCMNTLAPVEQYLPDHQGAAVYRSRKLLPLVMRMEVYCYRMQERTTSPPAAAPTPAQAPAQASALAGVNPSCPRSSRSPRPYRFSRARGGMLQSYSQQFCPSLARRRRGGVVTNPRPSLPLPAFAPSQTGFTSGRAGG
ncbi:hypothetical protein GALMADRAFT_161824 [Galerina marginata CBS 339.88]|uniref:Uncharacterized protein n=1 Tax=Galerina marginata (strain CBS 339.88) TaxID=685588 RepID=A0A067SJX8_GALM3|nr:hypothetical protein GALMADRAFT_161824 [Galerina marginata CBS 339.88]